MLLPLLIALAAAPAPDVAHFAWKHVPTDKQLAAVYPARTEMPEWFDIDLRCRIIDTAGRVTCIVVSESPSGYDVGGPVAKLFTRFARLDMHLTPGGAPGRTILLHYRVRPSES